MKCPTLLISAFLLCTSCKVGPNYHTPVTLMPDAFTEAQENKTFFPLDEDLVDWWKIFNDPFLNGLLEETVSGSFDYHIALEQVYQARAQYWVQFTQILPEFDFDAQTSRFRVSQASLLLRLQQQLRSLQSKTFFN